MRALIAVASFLVGLATVAGLWAGSMPPPRKPSIATGELILLMRLNPDAFAVAANAAQVDPTPPPKAAAMGRFARRWRDDQGNAWLQLKGGIEAGLVRRERGRPLARSPDILLRLDGDWWYWEFVPTAP